MTKPTSSSFDFAVVFNKGSLIRKLVTSYMVYATNEIPFFTTFATSFKLNPDELGREQVDRKFFESFLFD
mgnify:CR=1 FL=1